jgi:hypothetical protein
MVTFLITSVLFFGLVAIALYFWQRPAKTSDYIELPPPPPPAGLFTNQPPEPLIEATTATEEDQQLAGDEDERDGRIQLAQQFIETWQESPDRVSTAKMLHLAALSDDAGTYQSAVETALRVWQKGGIPDLTAQQLLLIFNSEFWVLSSSTRNSGAGFLLKRTLSHARRDLELANNPT